MLDFLKSKFEYLLISFWMGAFVLVIVHFVHHGGDAKALDWGFNAFSALLGALLGLITGQRLAKLDQTDKHSPTSPVPPTS